MSAGIIGGNLFSARLYSFVFNPASVAINTTVEQTVTVRGLVVGEMVIVSKPTVTAGLLVASARVSAKDTLAITLANVTSSAIDAASETWQLVRLTPESGAATVAAVV